MTVDLRSATNTRIFFVPRYLHVGEYHKVFFRAVTPSGETCTKIGAHNRPEEKIATQGSYMFSRGQRLGDSVPVYGVTAGRRACPRAVAPLQAAKYRAVIGVVMATAVHPRKSVARWLLFVWKRRVYS